MDAESTTELSESCSDSCDHDFSEESLNLNFGNKNENLEKRLSSLKDIMDDLRAELSKERVLWKKEVEEVEKLSTYQPPEPICKACKSCTSTSTCTCFCEEADCNESTTATEPTLNDMSILDYEQKLSVYQQALAKAHAEKRMHLRRHLAASAYKRRLMELENMCNLELLKVKHNVQNLQPLQAIASEWNFAHENTVNLDDEITGGQMIKNKEYQSQRESVMALETYGNKLNSEIKDLVACVSPAHSSFGTSSSLQPEEDEDTLMTQRLNSVGWYWYNDKNNCPFNPLM